MRAFTRAAPRRRIALISKVKGNPYVSLLAAGLREAEPGLAVETVERLSLKWVWRNRRQFDLFHLHWVELFFVYPSLLVSLRRWVSVVLALFLAHSTGIRLVYTIHNVQQHEGKRPVLVWMATQMLLALAHALHVHNETVRSQLGRWQSSSRVWVIPHGNYVSAYPNTCSRSQARAHLGIPAECFVYLSLGRVRPYKGILELLRAFRDLEAPLARLIIAGEEQETDYAAEVRALAGKDDRVMLRLSHVPDEEIQFYMRACDIAVLPYKHVTTSGAALLAFSFGVPIIAPNMGGFAQLVGDRACGILYAPGDETALKEALYQAQHMDLSAPRQACEQLARAHDWVTIAGQHAAMYRACMKEADS